MDIIQETTSSLIINNKKKRVYWTPEKDALLLKLVGGNWENLNWKKLTIDFNMTYKQCYDRYLNINPLVKKENWTVFEEQKLKDLIEIYGEKWSLISREFGGTRSGKQIRHHFKIVPILSDLQLNKSRFSNDEDARICDLYQKYGPKWEYLSTFFENRSGDAVKNRYYNQKIQKNKLKEALYAEEVQKNLLSSQILIKFEKPCLIIKENDNDSPIFTDVIEESNPEYDYFEHNSEYNFNGEFFNDISLGNIFSGKVYFDHSEGV